MFLDEKYFYEVFQKNELACNEELFKKFNDYAEFLCEYNEKVNLTAITEPGEIILKHFIDSLVILKYVDIKENSKIIDVGTGAGFPLVPLKIYRPDLNITLLDSLNKRVNFLKELSIKIDFPAEFIHERAEIGSHREELREKFDVSIARAVSALPVLSEFCIPYVKKDGLFIALKGPNEDIDGSKSAIKTLGAKIKDVVKYKLNDVEDRTLIIISKIKTTDIKYPRNTALIKKKSL